jgi:hypothetical protein
VSDPQCSALKKKMGLALDGRFQVEKNLRFDQLFETKDPGRRAFLRLKLPLFDFRFGVLKREVSICRINSGQTSRPLASLRSGSVVALPPSKDSYGTENSAHRSTDVKRNGDRQ